MGHVYTLDGGTRVRLRMVQGGDLQAIRRLLHRLGSGESELSASRFVYFDPRERYVLSATGLIGGEEILLGLGVVRLDQGAAEPEVLVADGDVADDVRALLTSALSRTARTISRARAA